MDKICIRAYGKINLGLDVIRKRDDGYHEVKMVMQTIDVYDEIYMKKTKTENIQGYITIESNSEKMPLDESNLIYKAVKMLTEEFDIKDDINIYVEKKIPMAAGMAGGSSDCAAALKAVNTLFDLGLSNEELKIRGVKLGADVPYCIEGGTCLSEGIGEKLTRLSDMVQCYVVIAKPPISVSTKYVYENLHANELESHPDIDALAAGIKNKDLCTITNNMENVLESVTAVKYPVINQLKKIMIDSGAKGALMSGSGPTVFGIFDSKELAVLTKEKISYSKLAGDLFVTTIVNDIDNTDN